MGMAIAGQSVIVLSVAILAALGGMMIFNLGLTYGLSDLGQQVPFAFCCEFGMMWLCVLFFY